MSKIAQKDPDDTSTCANTRNLNKNQALQKMKHFQQLMSQSLLEKLAHEKENSDLGQVIQEPEDKKEDFGYSKENRRESRYGKRIYKDSSPQEKRREEGLVVRRAASLSPAATANFMFGAESKS